MYVLDLKQDLGELLMDQHNLSALLGHWTTHQQFCCESTASVEQISPSPLVGKWSQAVNK